VRDLGLATERTALSRRRTTLPFLVVALLGARAALDAPLQGLVVAVLACVGAAVAVKRSPTLLAVVVVLLALAALAVPPA
jgi:uncharacterized membrane protein YidH (DUF202 family)